MTEQISFLKRASLTRHPLSQRLFKLMEDKKTNLALAADISTQREVLQLAEVIGPHICLFKTHVDILSDFTPDFGIELRKIANRHNFLIFEDRKFADIGQTVSLQYSGGIYRISDWADIVNAHIVPGPGIIDGLKVIGEPKGQGLLLLAEMSSAGTVAKGSYTRKAVEFAEQYPEYVMGFISLKKISDNPGFIHMTPGVKLRPGKDSLGQRYRTVDQIIGKNYSDIAIVGRDITHSENPLGQAVLYRERAWNAYTSSRKI
ncbi:MAG: orotidine-5'-phosphate decarboxylase [Verrucomicrobia bacterium]|nr:orotidine-5'-phosphate decarboxylase [Verrucomicrobiota bacterium]